MSGIHNLEFRNMLHGQGNEVNALILEALKAEKGDDKSSLYLSISGVSPQGQLALKRYISPEAIEHRSQMGYSCELAYVSGAPVGVIETKGADKITMLYIHPDYVNKGLGSRLIARAVSRCSEIAPAVKQLTTFATDDTVDFYERVGFVRNGARKESGGVYSTPYKLPLKTNDKLPSAKLHSKIVEFFVFSGTGNSLLVAKTVAETLKQEQVSVRIRSMDKPCPKDLGAEVAIGLAFPVACFSTYPTVWRFIESMPLGEGREVFAIGTHGGAPFGMHGPMRKILSKKGYRPIGAKFFTMPSNYNNKTFNAEKVEKNAARVDKAVLEAQFFAYDLLNGKAVWGGGVPALSALAYRLAQKRKPWDWFYKVFPVTVDKERCVRCKRCVDICPAGAVALAEEYPAVDRQLCESCQRCIGFCPKGAIHVPGKPAEPYRAMSYEDFKASFE